MSDHHDDNWFKHSSDEGAAQEAHGEINGPLILGFLAVVIVSVVVVIAILGNYFGSVASDLRLTSVENSNLGEDLKQMTDTWNSQLHGPPAWMDEEAGTIRIPIDRAKEAVIEQYAGGS